MKYFREEIAKFEIKLRNRKTFALVRFGDGEMAVINKKPWNTLNRRCVKTDKTNHGLLYKPRNKLYQTQRRELLDAFVYRDPNYFVGVICADKNCCASAGESYHEQMKTLTGIPEENLTFSQVFGKSNFEWFKTHFTSVLNNSIITCHKEANIENLPFFIKKAFRVDNNAWINSYNVVSEIDEYIKTNNVRKKTFIFCAGALSKILIHKLFKKYPNNTFIDVGAALDIWLQNKPSRLYQVKDHEQTTCQWVD